jgi:Taurine catabolism dioxygenase TauD, TfdA family
MTRLRQNTHPDPSRPRRAKRGEAYTRPGAARLNGHPTRTADDPPHRANPLIHDLSPEEARRLEDEARLCPHNPFDERALEPFLREAHIRSGSSPEWLRRLLTNFAMDGNLDGALLIRGFRQDPDLPPTPTASGAAVRKDTFLSEFYMASVGMALGEMVGYSQEKKGAFWQSLNPTKAHESRQTSESSGILLTFHTEVMFHPHMPDYVFLYGLHQDPEGQARTIVASIRRFHRLLPLRTREVLFRPLFKTGIDTSFGNEEGRPGRLSTLRRPRGPFLPLRPRPDGRPNPRGSGGAARPPLLGQQSEGGGDHRARQPARRGQPPHGPRALVVPGPLRRPGPLAGVRLGRQGPEALPDGPRRGQPDHRHRLQRLPRQMRRSRAADRISRLEPPDWRRFPGPSS